MTSNASTAIASAQSTKGRPVKQIISDRKEVSISVGRKPVLGYYVAPSVDGMVFGIIDPRVGDVHLTILWKDGKLGSHITDNRKFEKHEKYPWDTHINPKLLVPKVQRIMARWVRPKRYHPARKAWLLPRHLEKKLGEIGSLSERKTAIEVNAFVKLWEIRHWKKVPIKSLLGKGRLAFVDSPSWSFVIPISDSHMLIIPWGSMARLQTMVARAYGFERYFEYVASESVSSGPRTI